MVELLVVVVDSVDVVDVTLCGNAPVKLRSKVCGIPRWLLAKEDVWFAVRIPLSLKLIMSPSLHVWSICPQAGSEYCPPLVSAEPTT